MRLIDADDLMRILIEDEEYNKDIPQRADGIRDTMISVMSAPTIDAVQVVRCKDCKYFESEDDCDCPMDVGYSDFFCKMGERRKNETN